MILSLAFEGTCAIQHLFLHLQHCLFAALYDVDALHALQYLKIASMTSACGIRQNALNSLPADRVRDLKLLECFMLPSHNGILQYSTGQVPVPWRRTQREAKGRVLFKAFTSALAHRVRDSRLLKWGPRRCSAPPSMESKYRSLILTSLGPTELLHGAGYTRVARLCNCAASPQCTAWQHALSALSGILHNKEDPIRRSNIAPHWSTLDQGTFSCDMDQLMMARSPMIA